MKSICTTLIALMAPVILSSASFGSDGGGKAGSFLDWGVGARAIAMGGASGAIVSDPTALHWNPAGLKQTDGWSVSAMHALIFEDRAENYLAVAHPFSRGAIGVGWLSFGVSDIQKRDEYGSQLSSFSDTENAFMLGASMPLLVKPTIEFSLGLTAKYFYHSLLDNRATGWGADVGTKLELHRDGLLRSIGLAVVVKNIGATMKWNTVSNHEDDIPMSVCVGSSAQFDGLPVIIAFDVEKQKDRDAHLHAGAEYAKGRYALRAGLDDGEMTAGAGFTFRLGRFDLVVDYAYTDDAISTNGLHFFSFGGRL